jgi:hypothetical protein
VYMMAHGPTAPAAADSSLSLSCFVLAGFYGCTAVLLIKKVRA